jgi:hypothetical protein
MGVHRHDRRAFRAAVAFQNSNAEHFLESSR